MKIWEYIENSCQTKLVATEHYLQVLKKKAFVYFKRRHWVAICPHGHYNMHAIEKIPIMKLWLLKIILPQNTSYIDW